MRRVLGFRVSVPRLLAAPVAVVAIRRRPNGQYGECLLAQLTSPPPHPDPIVALVMSLLAPASVADDCVPAAGRTPARQLRQADLGYPGSALSSVHDSAIKRITAGVKARRLVSPPRSIRRLGLHPPVWNSVERKKNQRIQVRGGTRSLSGLAGYWRPGITYAAPYQCSCSSGALSGQAASPDILGFLKPEHPFLVFGCSDV